MAYCLYSSFFRWFGDKEIKTFQWNFAWEVAMEIWAWKGCSFEASDRGEIWMCMGRLVYYFSFWLWSTDVAPKVPHPRPMRRDARDAAARAFGRVPPRHATWFLVSFSRLAPMRLRLWPIRFESGQLGPYWPESAVSADSSRNSKKKKNGAKRTVWAKY